MTRKVAGIASTGCFVLVGLASAQWPTYTVEEPYDWNESTAEEQGLDSAVLDRALSEAEQLPYLNALLVVGNGHLVAERYSDDTEATDANTVMSVSKSFLSALTGIALREGYLQSLGQPVLDFFPEYAGVATDARKHDITLRHLLTMTSGLPYDDHADHWNEWMPSSDWVEFCLALDLVADPGAEWHYSTCSTHIMSALLTRATGRSTLELATDHLFHPLGITIGGWRRDPQGIYRGGWDMYFTPRDMARFGYLYLEKGRVEGERILARPWVKKTTRANVGGWSWGAIGNMGYGYWWWTGNAMRTYKIYLAIGYAGQYIVNIPRLKTIVVMAADANYDWGSAGDHGETLINFLAHFILVPLKDALGSPPHAPVDLVGRLDVDDRGEPAGILSWSPSPDNAEARIASYRVYNYQSADASMVVDEVGVDTTSFRHPDPQPFDESSLYVYGLTAVTEEGSESRPGFIWIHGR